MNGEALLKIWLFTNLDLESSVEQLLRGYATRHGLDLSYGVCCCVELVVCFFL